jgi:hypothetical protein
LASHNTSLTSIAFFRVNYSLIPTPFTFVVY